ncbi:MAG: membrane protein insertion efficiency factor YidD [Spirochaetales bacterium]|nr:membrane protein insertion efficiency factor YidD [Spirochaetales bacterium]
MNRIVKRLFLSLIWVYKKVISPVLPRSCRFYPTCSTYAQGAIEKYGPWKGSVLAVKRILKCHPYHPGGYDPVP